MDLPKEWASEPFCYVTTTGRRTGDPHTIEIWFALEDNSMYLLAEGRERADWVRNMRSTPEVTVKVREVEFAARARFEIDPDEEATARRKLATEYQDWTEGAPMSAWATTALLVALDPL